MRPRRVARAVAALALLLAAGAASAQQKPLTLDDIYDPQRKVDFGGQPVTGLSWIDETHYLWPRTDPRTQATEMLKVDALTGRSEPKKDSFLSPIIRKLRRAS